jgi:hypothetical protein
VVGAFERLPSLASLRGFEHFFAAVYRMSSDEAAVAISEVGASLSRTSQPWKYK